MGVEILSYLRWCGYFCVQWEWQRYKRDKVWVPNGDFWGGDVFFLSFFKVLVLKLRFFRTLCFGLLHSPVEFLINNVFLFYNENFNLCSKNILNLESKLLIISKETHINLTENILVTFINPTFWNVIVTYIIQSQQQIIDKSILQFYIFGFTFWIFFYMNMPIQKIKTMFSRLD